MLVYHRKIPLTDLGQRCERVGVDNLEICEHSLVFYTVQPLFAAEQQKGSEKYVHFTEITIQQGKSET